MIDLRSIRSHMRRAQPLVPRLFLVAALYGCVGTESSAQPPDVVEPGAVPPAPAQPQITEETLDQWAFGQNNGAVAAHANLERLLTLHLEFIERTCGITEMQKKNLLLPALGDLKRLSAVAD